MRQVKQTSPQQIQTITTVIILAESRLQKFDKTRSSANAEEPREHTVS